MKSILCIILLCGALAAPALGADARSDAWAAVDRGDYDAAAAVWQPLAEKGEVQAQIFMGHLEAMRDRYIESANWYRAAAEKGNPVAQALLATLYLQGRGVARDPVQAYAWYDMAAEQGHTNAQRARDATARQMSDPDIAKAQELAADWRSREVTRSN